MKDFLIKLNEFIPDEEMSEIKSDLEQLIKEEVERTMMKFKIKKGVEYKVMASDKVIVLENTKYLTSSERTKE